MCPKIVPNLKVICWLAKRLNSNVYGEKKSHDKRNSHWWTLKCKYESVASLRFYNHDDHEEEKGMVRRRRRMMMIMTRMTMTRMTMRMRQRRVRLPKDLKKKNDEKCKKSLVSGFPTTLAELSKGCRKSCVKGSLGTALEFSPSSLWLRRKAWSKKRLVESPRSWITGMEGFRKLLMFQQV